MPYRIDIASPPANALNLLIELGALDVEPAGRGLGAILPDSVTPEAAALALNVEQVAVSDAVARDSGSVWMLSPRAVLIGGILIAPSDAEGTPANALRMRDSSVFGTGHHPTTALCVEAMAAVVARETVPSVLDVGTGSGILALAALRMGIPEAVGIDLDAEALRAATENAGLNCLSDRLGLVHGGPDAVNGRWPLVVANVLAAPLIEMAPMLVRRLERRGRLILSGIPWSLESEVRHAYQHLGMRYGGSATRFWSLPGGRRLRRRAAGGRS